MALTLHTHPARGPNADPRPPLFSCKALTLYTQSQRVAEPVTLAKGPASSLTTRLVSGGQWPAGVFSAMLAVATSGAAHEPGQLPLSVYVTPWWPRRQA